MTAAYAAIGSVSHGAGTATPTLPASIAAGDLLLTLVGWANSTDVAPTISAGWTAPANNTYIGGSGAFGIDTGNRNVTVFYRFADGTEAAPTVTNSGTTPTTSGQIIRVTKTLNNWVVPIVVGGSDTTSGTAYSVTAGSDPGGLDGDHAVVVTAWTTDAVTVTSPLLTWTGTGAAALTGRSTGANTQGNDLRYLIQNRDITGTSSAAPVYSATGSAACAGSSAVVICRDFNTMPRVTPPVPPVPVVSSFTR